MFTYTWLVILTISCIAWARWIFFTNRRRLSPPLPPGPLGLPVVGSLPFLGPELPTYFKDLSKTYGPLFKLQLGRKIAIVVGSPSVAKEVLKDHDIIFANHDTPVAGREGTYGGLDVVWTPYGHQWKMLRKICVREVLGSTTLDALYRFRKNEIHKRIQHLKEQLGSIVNIRDQMFLTAMNVITSTLWGGNLESEEMERLGNKFRAVVSEFVDVTGAPNVSDFFPGIAWLDLQGIAKKMRVCAKKFDDMFEDMINRSRKMESIESSCNKDVLQILLELESKNSSGDSQTSFTIAHLKALLMDIVTAGTETTSNTIEFAMAEIINKPEVIRKAQQELDLVLGTSNASFEESQILHLPYLQAIMKETMRLHPVVPLLIPHCPSESCIVGGYTIPKGARVFINVWAIQRDPSLWEDPLEFKPERFLNEKHDFNGSDFSFLPFGSGRRICAGIGMAERMIMFSLASLLHHFDWKLPREVDNVDVDEKFGIAMKKKTPLLLIPSPRV